MSTKVGAVTIGQSPRDDVVPVIQVILGAAVEIIQCGALDGLDRPAVETEAPKSPEGVLATRMRDGSAVKVRREFLVPRIKHCIHSLEEEVELVLMLCTDPFCGLDSRRLLLLPGRILTKLVAALEVNRVGVMTPLSEQTRSQHKRWSKFAREVTVRATSPYTEADKMEAAGEAFAQGKVDLIVMDCIGYTPVMKQDVAKAAGVPVLLPSTTLAHTAAELLSGLTPLVQ
jgi:protein AroM